MNKRQQRVAVVFWLGLIAMALFAGATLALMAVFGSVVLAVSLAVACWPKADRGALVYTAAGGTGNPRVVNDSATACIYCLPREHGGAVHQIELDERRESLGPQEGEAK